MYIFLTIYTGSLHLLLHSQQITQSVQVELLEFDPNCNHLAIIAINNIADCNKNMQW